MKNFNIIVFSGLLLSLLSIPMTAQVTFTFGSVNYPCAEAPAPIQVPLNISNIENVSSFSMTVRWDPTALSFTGVSALGSDFTTGQTFYGNNTNTSAAGYMTFSWTRTSPLTVAGNPLFFTLSFTKVGSGASTVGADVSPTAPTEFLVLNTFGNELPKQVNNGNVGSTDTQAPSITCPSNVTVAVGGSPIVNGIAPTNVADNCGSPSVGYSIVGATTASQPNNANASGTSFAPGTSVVTYTATDGAGLTSACSFQVQITQQFSNLTFEVQGTDMDCNSSAGLPVNTYLFDNIVGFQHSFTWNPSVLVFDSIGAVHPSLSVGSFGVNSSSAGTGSIGVSWTVTNPAFLATGQTVPAGSTLFKLYFKAIGASAGASAVQFTNMPSDQLVINTSGEVPANYVSSTVNVLDMTNPTLTCPANQTVTVPNGTFAASVAGLLASVSDNCGIASVQYTRIVGAGVQTFNGNNASGSYGIGTTVVTFTATDFAGQSATCSTTVQVNGPVVIGYTVGNATVDCASMADILVPIFTSNIQDVANIQSTIQFNPALLMYQGYYTAQAINTGSISFIPFENNVGSGFFQYSVNSLAPSYLPNVLPGDTLFVLRFKKILNFTSTQVSVSDSPTPTEFSDSNFAPLPFATPTAGTVTINDLSPPSFDNCPSNITAASTGVQGGSCGATVTWPAVTATDNCTSNVTPVLSSGSLASGSFFPLGASQVTYTSTDDRGQVTTCTFSVTVTDNSPVTFNYCPPNVALNLSFGKCDTLFAWVAPTIASATSTCGILSVTSPTNSPSIFGLGATTVQYTATSNSGTTGTCTFTVTVQQSNPPVFNNCPANVTLNIADGCDTVYNFVQPSLAGMCNLANLSVVKPTGNVFPVGNTTVTYTATGVNGVATCSFIVTVKEATPPSITCPASDTVYAVGGSINVDVSGLIASASDNCGTPSLSFTVSGNGPLSGNNASGIYPLGVSPVIFTANDASGNTSSCSFEITVLNIPDTVKLSVENITIGCQDDQAVVLIHIDDFDDVQQMQFTIDFDEAFLEYVDAEISTDLGSGFALDFSSAASGTLIFSGGNSSGLVDTLPNDIILQLTFNVLQSGGGTTISLPNLTSGAGQVYFQFSDNSGDILPYTLTNGVLTIQDVVSPIIVCPSDTMFVADILQGQLCGVMASWGAATASDNCSVSPTITTSAASGSFFGLGTTMVTFTATDDAGLASTCSINVVVTDTIAPVFNECPSNITLYLPANGCSANGVWSFPTISDVTENCGVASIVSDSTFASSFVLGVNTVTYTATDFSGNTGTCTFMVTVLDTIAPSFATTCPSGAEVNSTTCTAVYGFILPEAMDNCDADVNVYSIPASGSSFLGGMHTITIYAEDASNNVDSCKFTLVVNAVAGNPELENCQTTNVLYQVQDDCFYIIDWEEPKPVGFCGQNVVLSTTITDQAGVVTPVSLGDTIYIGAYTVTFIATDETGAADTCSFLLTVNDSQAPVLSCPTSTIQVDIAGNLISNPSNFITSATIVSGCSGIQLTFATPTVTDNCSLPVVTQSAGLASSATFPLGNTSMIYQATDAATNMTTCQFTVEIIGIEGSTPITTSASPVCPGDDLILSTTNIDGAVYTWTGPSGEVLGNASSVTVANFTDKEAGTYDLTVTIPNANCTFNFSAVDIDVVAPVTAHDDTYSVFVGSTIDTMKILENDIFGTDGLTYTLLTNVSGVNDLGNGVLSYTGSAPAGRIDVTYEVCSVACPDVCNSGVIRIFIKDTGCVFIPNLITPNGDDLNDEFILPCLEFDDFPTNSIVIYNQWGDVVYEASPYRSSPKTLAWKGTLNNEDGKPLPDGVYYYIFKESPTASAKKGFVQIMR